MRETSQVQCPTLVVHGDKDEYFEMEDSEYFKQHIPNARSVAATAHRLPPTTTDTVTVTARWQRRPTCWRRVYKLYNTYKLLNKKSPYRVCVYPLQCRRSRMTRYR